MALMAWMVAASRDTISQAFFIYVLAFLIPASGLIHCIAGSSEVLISVFAGEVPFTEYLVGFLLLATLGNAAGGVFLVALLNYGQVAVSDKKITSVRVHRRPATRLLSRRVSAVCRRESPDLE